jgi:hypothetical protein
VRSRSGTQRKDRSGSLGSDPRGLRLGIPVFRRISLCGHAVVITPVGSLSWIAHGTASSTRCPARKRRRPSPCQCRVSSHVNRFEACSTFTRVTACLIAGPPSGPLSRRLRRFRHLHHRFDSFRLERPSCRGDWLPLEIRNLSRRTLTPIIPDTIYPAICPRSAGMATRIIKLIPVWVHS